MKEKLSKVIFVLVLLFLLYLFFAPVIVFEIWDVETGGRPFIERTFDDIKEYLDTSFHKREYNKKLNEYIVDRFGEAMSEKIEIVDNKGRYYIAKCEDIMDSKFRISYYKEYDYCYDDFNSGISTDPKFQHLYSEWVKKQVGIDDENVEFGFTGNFDKPYIEFDKITSLSEDYREVFENTHNLYFNKIVVDNYNLDESNLINECEQMINNYYYKIINEKIINTSEKIVYVYIDIDEFSFYYNLKQGKVTDIYHVQEKIL